MKTRIVTRISWLLLCLLVAGAPTFAAAKPDGSKHRVVFELTTDDPMVWEAVLNNVENLQKAFGPKNSEIEVAAHGNGLNLLRTSNSTFAERLQRIAQSGVVFAACNNTMQRIKLSKKDLFPLSTIVDSGVAEVVRKQEAGWAYIKSGFRTAERE